jgi:HD-GYP domain-containing protein (c-di-GMP phosphodiesterase class II)
VGKVGVPDAILRKPGRLDEAETEEMRKHCGYGAELLRKAEARLEFRSFLAIAIQVAAHHHERWDGKGYPAGLAAAAIPLSARIMAVADSYDAMRSRRSYKEPYPHGRCVEILRAESGAQFDPAVISAFLAREADIAEIAARLGE